MYNVNELSDHIQHDTFWIKTSSNFNDLQWDKKKQYLANDG